MNYKCFIAIAIVLISCNDKKNSSGELPFSKLPEMEENIPVVSFDLSQTAGEYEMAEHGDVEYVKFEETEHSMLADITKVILTSQYIFLLDIKNESLYQFNRKGGYIRTIGKLGRGPGEYTEVGDFDVSEKDQEIHLYADDDQKINIYDFEGNFKKNIRIRDFGYAMRRLSNGSFITLRSGALYNASFWSSTGEHLSTIKQHDERIVNYQMNGTTLIYNNQCFLMLPFNNTIYTAQYNTIKPVYKLDYGIHTFPSEQIRSNSHFTELTTNKQYVHTNYGWAMTAQSIWIMAFLDQKFKAFHYSKGEKSAKVYEHLFVDNLPVGDIVGSNSECIIFKISPIVAVPVLQAMFDGTLKGNPPGFLKEIKEESNPFIAIVNEKKVSDL